MAVAGIEGEKSSRPQPAAASLTVARETSTAAVPVSSSSQQPKSQKDA